MVHSSLAFSVGLTVLPPRVVVTTRDVLVGVIGVGCVVC